MRSVYYLLLLSLPLVAQQPARVTGLKRTRIDYLLRQVPGFTTATDSSTLWSLRQQLVNLPLLADATFRPRVVAGGDTLVYWTFDEARTVFPLLSFGGLADNIFFLLGVRDINWRGRGNQLEAYYQNNAGEHNFRLFLANPNLRYGRWGYSAELQRYAAREPLYFPERLDYQYVNLTAGFGISYTLRPRSVYRLGANVFREHYTRLDRSELGPADLRQTKFLLKASYHHDRRDYFGERQAGWFHSTVGQTVLTGGQTTPFFIGWHELRHYRLTGRRGNLAGRLRMGLSSNDATPFAPFVLDSQFNLRGIGNRIDRGTAQLVLNLEYRHSFVRDTRDRFVLQGVAFSDLGSWRSPGGSLSDLVDGASVRHFVGGGLRLASPRISSAVVRIDYGTDVAGTDDRGLVVGFGQFF